MLTLFKLSLLILAIIVMPAYSKGEKASPEIGVGEELRDDYKFEQVPDGEQDQIADIAKKTKLLQIRRAEQLKDQKSRVLRGVHPKSHGCLAAEFEVRKLLPNEYRVGLFAKPGAKYQALIRYSNAAVTLSSDLNGGNGSRGMALKVFDIGSQVIVDDGGKNNQDFLMINTPAFAFPNVRSYARLTDALMQSPDGTDPTSAFSPAPDWNDHDIANLNETLKVLGLIRSRAVSNPLEVKYFAAAPSRFGLNRAMKFSTVPCGDEKPQTVREDQKADPNYLRNSVIETLKHGEDICLNFMVQVITEEQLRSYRVEHSAEPDLIENATAIWPFPFVEAATLTIPANQDISTDSETQIACEKSAFNPWHSLPEHQPIGGINRLRKPVYLSSVAERSITPDESQAKGK